MDNPRLIEPTVKRYLNETLKKIHEINIRNYNILFNLYLFIGIVVIVGIILYYMYKLKENRVDKEEEKEKKKEEILDMIYYYQQEAKKKENNIFTGLPIWKNEYDAIDRAW